MKWDDPEGGPETHDVTGPGGQGLKNTQKRIWWVFWTSFSGHGGSAGFPKTMADWWFGICLEYSPIVGMMIQSDELIFFRGVGLNHQPEGFCWKMLFSDDLEDDLERSRHDTSIWSRSFARCF